MFKNVQRFYSLKNIQTLNCHYNVIIGERSNGKTYACLSLAIENFCKTGEQSAIVRRWLDDFTGKRGQQMFDSLATNGVISKISKNAYNNVYYHASKWYLCKIDGDKKTICERPFAYGFAISSQEHDKSTSYPDITTIIFDEFITRKFYLPDEFILFTNVLSTIIRERNNVKIYMLGNTISKFCPYFQEMGLTNITKMNQGIIDIYTYGNSGLRVAVEYCSPTANGKKSDIYFAFDNPKLKMIKTGVWELDIYPHTPYKIEDKNIIFNFYIEFQKNLLRCRVVEKNGDVFIFVHKKTTPFKNLEQDLIFSDKPCETSNVFPRIHSAYGGVVAKIADLINRNKIFYATNEDGEIFKNFLDYCKH